MAEKIRTVYVSKGDLPLSCPNNKTPVWNLHPKVFIPLHETSKYTCPYCSTRYELATKSEK